MLGSWRGIKLQIVHAAAVGTVARINALRLVPQNERASIYPVIARSYLANTAYTRPEADRTSNLG